MTYDPIVPPIIFVLQNESVGYDSLVESLNRVTDAFRAHGILKKVEDA